MLKTTRALVLLVCFSLVAVNTQSCTDKVYESDLNLATGQGWESVPFFTEIQLHNSSEPDVKVDFYRYHISSVNASLNNIWKVWGDIKTYFKYAPILVPGTVPTGQWVISHPDNQSLIIIQEASEALNLVKRDSCLLWCTKCFPATSSTPARCQVSYRSDSRCPPPQSGFTRSISVRGMVIFFPNKDGTTHQISIHRENPLVPIWIDKLAFPVVLNDERKQAIKFWSQGGPQH
eukprot:TRINITY_DN3419_c0_g1_i1.p1 TRINITY_DN3419_c0_g1~~TRINITY_DN3419_c0_g1_i1.p1  ORF type:complete len:233 (-),score=35.82 TRINITY_DN3419_c0_g1_i1:84-782(-)